MFTNNIEFAMDMHSHPDKRVAIVSSYETQFDSTFSRLKMLLPPVGVVNNYVDSGNVDQYKMEYTSYLSTRQEIYECVYSIGAALLNRDIIIFTTPDEWGSSGALPFMEILIGFITRTLQVAPSGDTSPFYVAFDSTPNSLLLSVHNLLCYHRVSQDAVDKYIAAIPKSANLSGYLDNIVPNRTDAGSDLEIANAILEAKREDPSLIPVFVKKMDKEE